MFLFAIFLLAHATEIEWKDFVIDQYPEVKQYIAQKEAKIQSLERENMYLLIENDELQSKNKILEKKLRLAKERVEAMKYLVQRAEKEIRELEDIQNKEIIAEKAHDNTTQKWMKKEDKSKFNHQPCSPKTSAENWTNNNSMRSRQSPSKDRLVCSPNDIDYFLKNLKIREDGNFQSPFSRSWMSICDNRHCYGLNVPLSNADESQQKITLCSMPVMLKMKNPGMFWMHDEIFELHSIGSFFFGTEKESQNSSQRQVSMKFVSLRTGGYILFHYGRRCTGKDYSLYARDISKPVWIFLESVGQYGEKIGINVLTISDVNVKYMEMEMFIHAVKKQLENHSKK